MDDLNLRPVMEGWSMREIHGRAVEWPDDYWCDELDPELGAIAEFAVLEQRMVVISDGGVQMFFLRVVCTGRGRHPPAGITDVLLLQDGETTLRGLRHGPWTPPEPSAPTGGSSRESFAFECARCRDRNGPVRRTIRRSRWWALTDALIAANGEQLDLSGLP